MPGVSHRFIFVCVTGGKGEGLRICGRGGGGGDDYYGYNCHKKDTFLPYS